MQSEVRDEPFEEPAGEIELRLSSCSVLGPNRSYRTVTLPAKIGLAVRSKAVQILSRACCVYAARAEER